MTTADLSKKASYRGMEILRLPVAHRPVTGNVEQTISKPAAATEDVDQAAVKPRPATEGVQKTALELTTGAGSLQAARAMDDLDHP
jgi:hypothetical protein